MVSALSAAGAAKQPAAAAPQDPVKVLPDGGRQVTLSRPLTTHGGPTRTLTFRPLNAGVLMRMQKLPFNIVGRLADGKEERYTEIDWALLGRYVAELTGVQPTLLEHLSPTDFAVCLGVVKDLIEDAGGGN